MRVDFNFDDIYDFIEIQIKENDGSFYFYKNYELHLKDNSEIILKKGNYTLSRIVKEKGIFSLAKTDNDNKEMIRKTNQLLLEILKVARQDYVE